MNMVKKLTKKQSFLYILLIFTYLCLILDAVIYPDFTKKHIFFDSDTILIISLIVTTLLILIYPKIRDCTIFVINKFITVISLLSYLAIEFLEVKFYPNYVFSHLHITPQNLFSLFLFSFVVFMISNIKYKLETQEQKKTTFVTKVLLLISLIYILVLGLADTIKSAIDSDIYMLAKINFTYDDKMREKWGYYYDYMKFIVANTAENGSILLPPQDLSSNSGNLGLDRYFLYPRKLVNATEVNVEDVSAFDYIMIVHGDNGSVWPSNNISADHILKINQNTSIVTIKLDDYHPDEISNDEWGLMKIKE